MRFALGAMDPGDLLSLLPGVRAGVSNSSRAIAIWGSSTISFDFPISKSIPNDKESKLFPDLVDGWTNGLPLSVRAKSGLLGIFDIPIQQRFESFFFSELNGSSLLIVGAIGSGKSSFCDSARSNTAAIVLDCPTAQELEGAFQGGKQIICAMSSSFLMPLSLQRRFENLIYLRQGNLDQHLAAGLPKNQWNEKLPAGRGWFKNLSIHLAMPEPSLNPQMQDRELQTQVG
jgi:hypothetical protein